MVMDTPCREHMGMARQILIMGSFDTKAEELSYLASRVAARGADVLTLDTSMGRPSPVKVDYPASVVSLAAGVEIEEVRGSKDTNWATDVMTRGASKLAVELFRQGRFQGVVAIGGASNTGLSTKVMGALPFGVAKVMVSSMAAVPAYAGSYFGTHDITMINSVVDVAGLNPLLKSILKRAAAAVCAMAEEGEDSALIGGTGRPIVAVTEFKFSEECSRRAAEVLTEAGCEVICFHANGLGDRAMEELVSGGFIDAVLDLVPAGFAEEMLGGNRAAGPLRLTAAAKAGIPQVLTPCGFDMLSCGPLERQERGDHLWTSRSLGNRKLFVPDALRVQARTTGEELREVAGKLAERLKTAHGPLVFLLPLQGWSSLNEVGGPLEDRLADGDFTEALSALMGGDERLLKVPMALNNPEFGELAAKTLLGLMKFDKAEGFEVKSKGGGELALEAV